MHGLICNCKTNALVIRDLIHKWKHSFTKHLLFDVLHSKNSEPPRDLDDAIRKTYSALISKSSQPTIILIDGIDQVSMVKPLK